MEGVRMGLTMKEKQAVIRKYKARYQRATKKTKVALLNEFIRLTGYHRKNDNCFVEQKNLSAVSVL
jgi:hypothetical protein